MTHLNTNPRSGEYLTHTHSHITRAVAAKDSCYGLVSPHQHGIAVGRSRAFSPDGYTMLMRPNKAETAVHGCHCPGDMAVRMGKVLARPRVGVRVCHLFLLLFYKTLPSITNRKNGVLKLKLERQTANVIPRTRSRDFPRFAVCGIARKIRC